MSPQGLRGFKSHPRRLGGPPGSPKPPPPVRLRRALRAGFKSHRRRSRGNLPVPPNPFTGPGSPDERFALGSNPTATAYCLAAATLHDRPLARDADDFEAVREIELAPAHVIVALLVVSIRLHGGRAV